MQTSNYSAEFGGNSGAVINVASKRGTNQFHGVVFEFLKNNDLDARNFFSASVAPLKQKSVRRHDRWTGTAAEALQWPEQDLWLFSYEGIRQSNAVNATSLIPTALERSGNFNGTGVTIVDPFTKAPFPNDIIPASSINPIGQSLMDTLTPAE